MNQIDVQLVKPTCRQVKGELAAFYAAADKLREKYSEHCRKPDGSRRVFTLRLFVDDPNTDMASDVTTPAV